jgi:MinD superfamily P-loop ATPase
MRLYGDAHGFIGQEAYRGTDMKKPVEVAVISGKGGTGKTVLTSSLAALVDDKIMADCDVDAPDLHLLLKPQVEKREVFIGSKLASIDSEACIACGRCLEVCRFGAVRTMHQGGQRSYEIDNLACEGCGVCSWVCPEEAISLTDSVGGEWFVSKTRFGKMVHARLGAAQENSGKLVSIVRRQARNAAIADGRKLVIIDGPPGVGCPVIASVAGADLAVIVSEPTLSGLHDLERTLQLTRHFGIRTAVVINKHDLNGEMCLQIEEYLSDRGIPLVGKIPFSMEVNKAVAAGKTVVEYSEGELGRQMKQISTGITELLCSSHGAEAVPME